ncbi:MAG: DUF2007 domain-containing protein [Azonexus sp.]|jgi:hypothetical protein|nr:DUF2007 domain-containing protein [Azonexus sp.]
MHDQLQFTVVEIHTAPWEAHISRALLESEGIPAFLQSENQIWANWQWSLALGGVRVVVPAGYAEAAASILKIRDAGELQAALLAENPFGQPVCMKCGSTKFISRKSWLSITASIFILLVFRIIFPPIKMVKCAICGGTIIGET